MSDTSGALTLPAAPLAAGVPATDPSLGALLSFLLAVIGADTGAAWLSLEAGSLAFAGTPLLAKFGFAHNPSAESFSSKNLPALYLWRDGQPAVTKATQEWDAATTTVKGLWVLPPTSDEQARIREPFFNGFTAAVRRAISVGRHPAWMVAGDTYFDPDVFGSSLAHWMSFVSLRFIRATRTKLRVEDYGGKAVHEFDAYEFQLDLTERTDYDPAGYADPTTDLRGTVSVGGAGAAGIVTNSYQFHPVITGITPATGPAAGGTAFVITGTQLGTIQSVTLGGVPCTGVTVLDECSVLAVTGAHAPGIVAVVATQSSGASASLAAAFTYV